MSGSPPKASLQLLNSSALSALRSSSVFSGVDLVEGKAISVGAYPEESLSLLLSGVDFESGIDINFDKSSTFSNCSDKAFIVLILV